MTDPDNTLVALDTAGPAPDTATTGRIAELEDEVRRLQRRVRELERFERLAARMPLNTVVVQASRERPEARDMSFVWANETAYASASSDLRGNMNVPLSDVSMAIDMTDAIAMYQTVFESGQTLRRSSMLFDRIEGEPAARCFELSLIPLDANELAVCYQDITESYVRRREDEQKTVFLQRAEREQRLFASMAAHDLKAPLRAVRGYLEALEEDAGARLTDEDRFLVERAMAGAERMRELIDALLAFSRIDANVVELETIELDEVLDEVLDALGSDLRDRHTALTRVPLPSVRGYRALLTVLFQNLLSNALKYSIDRTPRIEITTRHDGAEHVIAVRDEGIGIPAAAGDGIFQPFGRAHVRSLSGSGLGLAVVERAVKKMGGRVWYESEVNVGTTFYVALPADESA